METAIVKQIRHRSKPAIWGPSSEDGSFETGSSQEVSQPSVLVARKRPNDLIEKYNERSDRMTRGVSSRLFAKERHRCFSV
jgi:hypothetical protein